MTTSHRRRNIWRSQEEKQRLLQDAEASSVWRVAIDNGIAPSQLYVWRKKQRERVTADGAVTAGQR